jgi:hypothetical protein
MGGNLPRVVMPCYFEWKAVLNRSKQFLLIVRLKTAEMGKFRLFYRDGKQKQIEPGPVLAIEVISECKDRTEFLDQLDEVDLRKMLLVNGAKHPQFAGQQKNDPVNDEEVKTMAKMKTLFTVDHVFATTIREEE